MAFDELSWCTARSLPSRCKRARRFFFDPQQQSRHQDGASGMLLVQLTRLAWSPRLASQRFAPPRFAPPCCSTVCTLADPPILAEAEAFFAERDVRLRSVQAGTPGSRTHSKIAVRAAGADGRGVTVGMFRPGTHDAVPCSLDESCHLPHDPAINQCIAAVTAALEREELSAYDETRRQGTLRYLQCSVERSSRRVQLTLVANAPSLDADPALVRFASALWSRHGGAGAGAAVAAAAEGDPEALQLHSIWVNLNPSKVNNILEYAPGAWQLLHADEAGGGGGGGGAPLLGGGALLESFPSGAAFVLSPWVFRQVSATTTVLPKP